MIKVIGMCIVKLLCALHNREDLWLIFTQNISCMFDTKTRQILALVYLIHLLCVISLNIVSFVSGIRVLWDMSFGEYLWPFVIFSMGYSYTTQLTLIQSLNLWKYAYRNLVWNMLHLCCQCASTPTVKSLTGGTDEWQCYDKFHPQRGAAMQCMGLALHRTWHAPRSLKDTAQI